jgi:hypothetical protein
MVIVIGFFLLFLLLLGGALFLLALVFLGIGAGLQLFATLVGAAAASIVTLAAGIQLAAGAAFALGVVLIAIGVAAFLFPSVRLFVRGLIVLLRLAANNLHSLLANLPVLLRTAADLQDAAGGVLVGAAGPFFTTAGNSLVTSANSVPAIPTVQFTTQSLWVPSDLVGNGVTLNVVTSITIGSAPITPIVNALTASGNAVTNVGQNAISVGQGMQQTATTLRDMATAIEQASQ